MGFAVAAGIATAADAALPLARVGIGSACPATSNEIINSLLIDKSALSFAPGLDIKASKPLK